MGKMKEAMLEMKALGWEVCNANLPKLLEHRKKEAIKRKKNGNNKAKG
jgi:hypothetical protein